MTHSHTHWFDQLSEAATTAMAAVALKRSFAAGEVISTAQQDSPGVFKVVSGLTEQSKVSKTGEKYILRFVYPGGTFGEIGLGNGRKAITDVLAKTDVELILYPTADMFRLAQTHDDILLGLLSCLSGHVFEAVTLFENSILSPVRHRIMQRLDLILRSVSPNQRGQHVIPISQGDLADLVGVSRQVINRELSELAKSGIVDRQYGELRIHCERLREEMEFQQVPTTQNSLFSQRR